MGEKEIACKAYHQPNVPIKTYIPGPATTRNGLIFYLLHAPDSSTFVKLDGRNVHED
jgi:hypothetical protein